MLNFPSMDDGRKWVVDDNVIINKTRPLLMTERDKTAEAAASPTALSSRAA